MKRFRLLVASLVAIFNLAILPLAMPSTAFAAVNPKAQACKGAGGTLDANGKCNSGTAGTNDLNGLIKKLINILLFIIGVASVIMIVIGGFRYVLSGGDSAGTTNAKNTIIYAVVGLIVAFMSYAIVNFVLGSL